MFPRHKIYDISAAIFMLGGLSYLVLHPNLKRYFVAGIIVGGVAVIGRNHGLYAVMGSVIIFFWLGLSGKQNKQLLFKGGLVWCVGIVIGYLPVIGMILFVDGFWQAYWQSIMTILERGQTNLSKPVPWPWDINYQRLSLSAMMGHFLAGLYFLAIPLFIIFGSVKVFFDRKRKDPSAVLFAVTVAMAIPYAHFAFSRPDFSHLAQGIFPVLIGMLILVMRCANKWKWGFLLLIFVSSFFVSLQSNNPIWTCKNDPRCSEVNVNNVELKLDKRTVKEIEFFEELVSKYAMTDPIYVTPFRPGIYPFFDKTAPTWETYAIWPRSSRFEKEEIARIKSAAPKLVIVGKRGIDRRDDYKFEKTHPLTYQYIKTHYQLADESNNRYEVFYK
jgi:hypothetical protein